MTPAKTLVCCPSKFERDRLLTKLSEVYRAKGQKIKFEKISPTRFYAHTQSSIHFTQSLRALGIQET